MKAELEEQRDFLLESLRDLEQERAAGDIPAADYEALRNDYTTRAASVLRALDVLEAGVQGAPPAATTARRAARGRTLRTAVIVVVVAGVAAGAGIMVGRSSGERLGRQQVSGTVLGDRSPVDADLARAQRLFRDGRLLDALKGYDGVLRRDPNNVVALTYRGWLLRLAGVQGNRAELITRGLASLDRAVQVDPSFADAHLFRGILLLRDRQDPAGALPELRRYLASAPPSDRSPDIEGLLTEALRDAGGTANSGSAGPATPATPTTTAATASP